MNDIAAENAAIERLNTMITPDKIKRWKVKIVKLLNPVFDGSVNVNILPVSEDPHCQKSSPTSVDKHLGLLQDFIS